MPSAFVELSFPTKGRVAEVLVQEGTQVKSGDVIARLMDQEDLDAQVSSAKMDLLLALKNSYDLQAGLPEAQMKALEDLTAAQEALRSIEYRVRALSNVATPMSTSLQAQYDQAKSELAVTQARVAEAQDRYNLLLRGPDPKDILIAKAQIETAQTALTAAKADLKKLELLAPMSGTIVNLNLAPGQYVSDGEVVLTVVDFSRWFIETDTLVENEVVKISPGQAVSIIPDSLPDVKMNGVVDTISTTYQERQGDVLYTARIRVENVDPRLRWGMKVGASFENLTAQK